MVRLALSHCPSLQELVLDCPFLRDVEFAACGMLSDMTLLTLSTTWLAETPGKPPGCCSRLRCVLPQLLSMTLSIGGCGCWFHSLKTARCWGK